MIDLKIGISLWFAAVVVAVWAYVSDRRRARKAGKIRRQVCSELPPRKVLQAYNAAMLREQRNDPEAMLRQARNTQGSPSQNPAAAFALGVALAGRTCLHCLNGEHEMYPGRGVQCACPCHARERVSA